MIRKDLAWTINEIAKNGDEAFYEGSIAKKIIQAMNENDGYMSAKDLREYQPRFSEPIKTTLQRIHSICPPSSSWRRSSIA